MAKSLHPHYVNRRLSIARHQLSLLKSSESLSAVHTEGVVDNALLQTYFALIHYVNELLETYHRPIVGQSQFAFSDQFFSQNTEVTELLELKQILARHGSWLALLVSYPDRMLNQAINSGSIGGAKETTSSVQLIHVVPDEGSDDDCDQLSISKVQWIIDECYQLIQRQRESLIEY